MMNEKIEEVGEALGRHVQSCHLLVPTSKPVGWIIRRTKEWKSANKILGQDHD
jgi:hypothetical protein